MRNDIVKTSKIYFHVCACFAYIVCAQLELHIVLHSNCQLSL